MMTDIPFGITVKVFELPYLAAFKAASRFGAYCIFMSSIVFCISGRDDNDLVMHQYPGKDLTFPLVGCGFVLRSGHLPGV